MITEETPEIQKENEKQKSGGWIAPLIIGCAIVLSASALAVGLYLFRGNREHTIIATGSANVDFDSDLCREERNDLFNKLNTGKWQIFGGHGGKKIYESN